MKFSVMALITFVVMIVFQGMSSGDLSENDLNETGENNWVNLLNVIYRKIHKKTFSCR